MNMKGARLYFTADTSTMFLKLEMKLWCFWNKSIASALILNSPWRKITKVYFIFWTSRRLIIMCLLRPFTKKPHPRVSLPISGVLYHLITTLSLFQLFWVEFLKLTTREDCDVNKLGHYLPRNLLTRSFIKRHIKKYLDNFR